MHRSTNHWPTVSVVVPTYNEALNLAEVLPTLSTDYEIVIVDGGSVDGTTDSAARIRPDARIVRQTRRGKGNAMACGFEVATGDIVVMFDADGSADAREIDLMVAALVNGADFVKGSRALHGGGSADLTGVRTLGNKALTTLVNVLFDTRYTDLCYGYNAFWREHLPLFDLPDCKAEDAQWGDGFEIETLLNCRAAAARLTILELPSYEHSRIHGASNLRAFSDGMRVLRTIRTEWQHARAQRVQRNPVGECVRWSNRRSTTVTTLSGSRAVEARRVVGVTNSRQLTPTSPH